MKKEGRDATKYISEMRELSDRIKEQDRLIKELEDKIHEFLVMLPNIPADDVVAGGKENNRVVRSFGEKPQFDFEPKDHVELVKSWD